MDTEKITQDLNRRFAEPLPEFYKRRIIVWVDEDAEFEDKLDGITLDNAKIAVLNGTNNFQVKKLLAADDPESNYLLYRPFSYESNEDNWFLDVELYSEEFRADLLSMWMDEMNLPQTPALRHELRKYRKFFNAQPRRNRIAAFADTPATSAQLQMAIMAVLANVKDAKPNAVMKAVLFEGLEKENNPIYQDLANYGIDEAFWQMVQQGTGYENTEPDLAQLAAHLLLTASAQTMREGSLQGLESFISPAHLPYCYDFVSDWMHSREEGKLREIAENVEEKLELPKQFMKMPLTDLADTEIFPCIDEVILVKLMTEIGDHIINTETITQTVEKRRTCVWYDSVKNYFEGILLAAKMQAFQKEHSAGFHTVEPAKVWKEYTTEYYIMDTWYREFHKNYSEIAMNYHPELSDRFNLVTEKVEGLYVTWFLGQLGKNWSDACADDLREFGRVLDVDQQTNFYHEQVEVSDSKVYVIVSDALRYEVGVSLAEQLSRETQAKVELKSMQAIFPTITKFGMAALLPHKALSVELKTGKTDHLAVLADGQSTEAQNREKILKTRESASVVLKYKNLIPMKRAERQALVKGMKVVYIYHDTIDEAGHIGNSVFSACDAAIDELKNMVRIIVNEWGGANIIITSDHGFLYTHSPLTEDDKVDKTTESEQDVEIGRRYAIMQKGTLPQYLMPVKFLNGNAPYEAFTPRENIRIRMKGGGLNFVHGGISLQELAVPVIQYHFLRNQSREYLANKSKYDTKPVEIALLSANRKICNMNFSLNFYQKEVVGGNRIPATWRVFFTDSTGKKVSDTQKIIADKTHENDRVFRCSFNLRALRYNNTEVYYLNITDENGQPIQREEFQIDIALAMDEFDFF